ncbi:MAG: MCP four helix bundle domain-containing protein, partial [Chloroflexi bacterium]|nr:MCP four helix bundle domain-containing protein [Chloroflexota bacterium]
MNAFNNLKVGVKLLGGFMIVALMVVVGSVVGYVNMKSINNGMTTLYLDRLVPVEDMGQVDASLYRMRGDVYKFMLIPKQRDAAKQAIA